MAKDYLRMFNRFFGNSNRMASTYKPVFLRALLDVADLDGTRRLAGERWLERKDGKLVIDLNFIAARFAKYYWDMEYSFRLRQSQDRQDANITRLVKAAHKEGDKPPTIEVMASEEMDEFRKRVIKMSIKPEVLVHLLTDMKGLYVKTGPSTIQLDDDIIEFLRGHRVLLKQGINNVLARYLEKLNRMTPQITSKIEGEPTGRKALGSIAQEKMKKWQDSRCFYCEDKFSKPHVDHVIPHNYVFATDLYNCTLACQQCNCTKSDMLPEKDIFEKVVERNRGIPQCLKKFKPGYSEESYRLLFDTCIKEYNGDEFFTPRIR
ncbi:HNH endonuclease [Cenarchaeum symbiosum A]|uniref:HNH endonuclease n=1 Tax=Cenarchaeum symbiosum (strain A) TaxID=414004 RepID=A0RTT4_CENSY|nr:HNH endonuclease [Cenarchaeum symbiosum A]